jgi:hypothetical protein
MVFAVSARGSLFLLVTELVEGCGAAASFFTPNQLLMMYLSFNYYKLFSYVILLHAVRGFVVSPAHGCVALVILIPAAIGVRSPPSRNGS